MSLVFSSWLIQKLLSGLREGAVAGRRPDDLSSLFPIPYSLTTGHLFPGPLPYKHFFNNLLNEKGAIFP